MHSGLVTSRGSRNSAAEQSDAFVQFYRAQDKVVAEVTEAHANLQSATARVRQADRSLRTAIIAYNGNVEGLRHTTRYRRRLGPALSTARGRLRTSAHEAGL